jgi:nucleotide-binding universal stress UspA family protein
MKKILVPLDFSKTSENAFVYALEMAKVYNAELLLLHTFDLPFVDTQVVTFNYAEVYDTLEVTNTNQFEEELAKLHAIAKEKNGQHITINHVMMSGDLVYNVKEVVRQEDVDFVVMGTNGGSGWFDSFVGTNTCSVISDVSVPVLSVSHDTEFHKMETIGFTTLYRDEDMHALAEVLSIAKKMNAQVKCLYVKTSTSEFKGQQINHWESHFKNEGNLEFFIISSEDVESTIEDFIVNQSIDVLAMVTHRKNFFTQFFSTSTTQKMSQHSKTPILAIHE